MLLFQHSSEKLGGTNTGGYLIFHYIVYTELIHLRQWMAIKNCCLLWNFFCFYHEGGDGGGYVIIFRVPLGV
jgi:hypothetical protein